jgi:hypothetical protein
MEELNDRMREIERRSRAAFDASVEAGDAATRARLARAREEAIGALRRPRVARPEFWLPLGAAAAALVAVLLWQQEDAAVAPDSPVLASEDLDLVTGGEDFDLLGEDADFLAWAANAADDGVG